jgi:hypothetical protein
VNLSSGHSIDEALELIQLKEAAEYVEPVARKLEINNLRVLQKIVWAVEELNEHLTDLDTAIKARILSQVAQIAAIRFRARCPLRSQDLQSGFHFGLLKATDRSSLARDPKKTPVDFPVNEGTARTGDDLVRHFRVWRPFGQHTDRYALSKFDQSEQ